MEDVARPLLLIAEDNEDNRFIAAIMLRHVGYRVIEAETGAAAIRMARSELPSLILMDVGMPDIDGWTATKTLKYDNATRHIRIVAFTAHALPSDLLTARDAGCDGYLAKPVEPSRLVREVAAVLSSGSFWPDP